MDKRTTLPHTSKGISCWYHSHGRSGTPSPSWTLFPSFFLFPAFCPHHPSFFYCSYTKFSADFIIQAKAFYINDRWSEISGHDKNEGMELGWLDLVYHEDLESVSRAVQEAIKGNPLKLEFRYENRLTEPPSIRWVLGQDSPDIPSLFCRLRSFLLAPLLFLFGSIT